MNMLISQRASEPEFAPKPVEVGIVEEQPKKAISDRQHINVELDAAIDNSANNEDVGEFYIDYDSEE